MVYEPLNRWLEPKLAAYRKETAGKATGDVLEIGGGTGLNLPFYSPDVNLTVVEPNPHMATRIRKKAMKMGREVRIVSDMGESLSIQDSSFDSVVSTLVLCCVRDLHSVVHEARRVLKPGGAFYFYEHVLASGRWKRRFQNWLTPPWKLVAGGCRLNRDIASTIRSVGFSRVEIKAFDDPVGVPLTTPSIIGVAYV